ncbi:GNAT family N-acetyltransferase [Bacillus gaemokensis]|uniref:Acetyltransferase n=1 Tax=Bacillus gaemokensis TaxID=574375 RepID=A0A073KCW4_9BACI|nr:GNAT family N-acetyltransferase [Bacillus gaemokensis]KEK24405.1 acetyltransferase [Bacillus gaemokensis]KYG38380.1 acetyltransferase [Bacillus gaemokensis]
MLYTTEIDSISSDMLKGFFVGWPNSPSVETHLKLLDNSDKVVLAIHETKNEVIGFITAISDGVLSAYIPFLEVLPEYQNQGIGKELIERMLAELGELYMIDLLCDENLQSYYEKFNMRRARGMIVRNYNSQAGVQGKM